MKLFERLPDSVMVGRKRVRLNLDFRNVLRMMEIMGRDDLMPDAKEYLAARCVCRRPIPGTLAAIHELLFSNPPKNDGKRITSFDGCESWTIKKAEHQIIGAFELWCWRRLLRVPCLQLNSRKIMFILERQIWFYVFVFLALTFIPHSRVFLCYFNSFIFFVF